MDRITEFRETAPAAQLIGRLDDLWNQDKAIEEQMARARKRLIISAIAAVAHIFISSFVFSFLLRLQPLTLGAAIFFGIKFYRLKTQNLDDRKLLTPLKLLQVLQADIPPAAPVRIAISFQPYEKHGQKLTEAKSGGSRRVKFEDTWMEVEGWLAGKNRFRVAVTQSVSLAERRKRKYVKKKERITETVSLHLRPNPKGFPALDRFPSQFAADQRAGGMRIARVRAAGQAVFLQAESDPYLKISGRSPVDQGQENLVQGQKLLTLLAAAFNGLQKCRAAPPAAGVTETTA